MLRILYNIIYSITEQDMYHRRQYHLNYIERDAIRDERNQISSAGDAKEPDGNKIHHVC